MHYPHIASRVFDAPLMVAEVKAQVIAGVLRPYFLGGQAMGDEAEPMEQVDQKKCYTVTPEGIALIPICGTLVRRGGWLQALSGVLSYESIERDVMDAATDPAVKGILLDMDSPGGEVSGLFDLLDVLLEARQLKPIYAVANDDCFSAAYAIASCAERIFVTRTGGVGSVGVIAIHLDTSKAADEAGLKFTVFRAGRYKAEFNEMEPLTDHATQSLQAEIDRLYGMFCEYVAQARGLTLAAVEDTEAQVYFGSNGIEVGFADQVGTHDEALAALVERVAPKAATVPASYPFAVSAMNRSGQPLSAVEVEVLKKLLVSESAFGTITIHKHEDIGCSTLDRETQDHPGGTAALSPSGKEIDMSATDPKAAAPAATVTTEAGDPKVVELFSKARAEGIQYVSEVNELCALAGFPQLAGDFIKAEAPLHAVRAALLEAKAKQSDAREVTSRVDTTSRAKESSQSSIDVGAIYDQLKAGMAPA